MPYMVDSKFELICTDGYVNVDAALPDFFYANNEKQTNRGILHGNVMGEPVGFVNGSIKHFINCILLGREPLITGHDGLMIAKALAAMVKSAETGKPVDVSSAYDAKYDDADSQIVLVVKGAAKMRSYSVGRCQDALLPERRCQDALRLVARQCAAVSSNG